MHAAKTQVNDGREQFYDVWSAANTVLRPTPPRVESAHTVASRRCADDPVGTGSRE